MGDYKVHHQYHYRTHHHGLGAGTPHFERVPFGVIAVEAGDGGDDECIYNHLYQRIDDGEESEIHFDAGDVRVRDDDSRDQRDGVSPDETDDDAEDGEQREEDDRCDDFREYQVARRIDAHDFEGVYLFGNAHRAYLGGDARTDAAGQDERHDRGAEFEYHRFARGVAHELARDEGRLEVDAHLKHEHGPHEDRYER